MRLTKNDHWVTMDEGEDKSGSLAFRVLFHVTRTDFVHCTRGRDWI